MADLKLTVDYSQVKAANKEIVQIGGSAKKSASVFEAAFKKAEAQQKESLNSLRQQIAFSKKMEVQKAKEAKVTANAAAMVAKEEERLKNKFVEGYTAMNIYTKELNDLALARKKGLIGTKEQTAAVAALNAQMKAGTGAFANAATGMQIVGKRANRTGVLAQQAGYQFGDFAVQVQSGTNPMVAFGQQATQLIGTFSMLAKSTRAIVAFSALGVIVPILTAIGAGLMRMSKEAKDSSEGISEFESKIKSLDSSLKDYLATQKAAKLGITVDESISIEAQEKALEEYKKTYEKVRDSIKANLDEESFGVSRTIEQEKELLQTRLDSSEQVQAALAKIKEAETRLAILRGKQDEEARKKRDADIARFREKTRLMQAEVQFGKDSLGYLGEAHQLELDKLQSQVKSGDLSQDVADLMSEQLRIQHQITLSMEHMSGIGIKNPFTDAIPEALNLKDIMYEMAVISSKIGRGGDTGMTTGSMDWFDNSNPLFYGGLLPPKLPENKPSGSVQADPAIKAKEAFDSLRASYDETYATQLKVAQAQKTVNEAISIGGLDAEKANKVFEDYKASLKSVESPMLDLANTMSGAMSDAFMSIADGTASVKDAFSDMVRVVIKKAFEMAVINPIINSIFGGIGGFNPLATFSSGGAFSKGSVQAYADGGVVGGPTTFPMSGGKTGLMGEAGPEAIMPLKRGANGKLGVQMEGNSGETINIVQNFSFAANGDDSVKKLIAQAAPQIANMTQKQIMDSRRRGGAMKSTFG